MKLSQALNPRDHFLLPNLKQSKYCLKATFATFLERLKYAKLFNHTIHLFARNYYLQQ